MAKKKATRKATRRSVSPRAFKPTLLIDTSKLRGNSLKVGKKAKVSVSGTIVEESLRDYESKGRKSFRLEIDKVTVPRRKA